MYEIFVRDRNRTIVAPVEDYNQLDAIPRFNDVGSWVLDLPATTKAAGLLLEKQAGIVVKKDGQAIFSGPVSKRYRYWDRRQNVLKLIGNDDLVWIKNRLALPVPSGPPYNVDYDVRTGPCETVIWQYINFNAGPGARTERQILGLTLSPDQGSGNVVTGRARFDNLLDLCRSLALSGGDLGFKVIQNGLNLIVQIYVTADKSAIAVFSSGRGNLMEYEYNDESAEANYVICGGGGEGASRIFAEQGDSESIVNDTRIESFRDRRDTSDLNELNQTIAEELSQKAKRTSLSITPIDTAACSFLKDYQLGDTVSVVVDGEQIKDVVREVHISLTRSGSSVVPVIGTPGINNQDLTGLFTKVSRLDSRLNNLERR